MYNIMLHATLPNALPCYRLIWKCKEKNQKVQLRSQAYPQVEESPAVLYAAQKRALNRQKGHNNQGILCYTPSFRQRYEGNLDIGS